jgi:hypothetical protein
MRLLLFIFLLLSSISYAQIPSYVPVYGLQCYYPFNGNGNDAGTFNNHLTNNGAVLTTDRFGNSNAAYSFNGSNQYLIKNTPSFTFNPNSTFTVSLWFNRQNTASTGIPIMHATTAAGNFIWIFQTGSVTMNFGTNKQQSAWIWAPSPTTTNVWTHIVLVYNAGAMTLYKDNAIAATATFTHTNVNSATLPLYIGRGVSGNYFYGKVDDIGIWNRCLSPCEINDLYTSSNSLTTVSAGPDLYACNGGSVTLNGTGANTYLWSPNITNGSSFAPTINQTYTLTGFDTNNCSAWDQTNVLIEQFSINAGPELTICQGDSAVLTATGSPNIIWNNNDVSNGIPFFPLTSGYVTAFATSPNGCLASDSILLTINPAPNIDAGPDLVACPGDSITLSATGAGNLLWNSSITNDTSFVPTSSGTFVVSGMDTLGCSNTDTLELILGNLPDLNAGPDQSICFGQEVTLSGTGGIFLFWDNNIIDGIPFIPQSSASYVLNGASNEGCVGTDTVFVSVNEASSNTINIAAIDNYTLNGQTYTSSGTYTQVLTNSVGCDSVLTINLTLDFTGLNENQQAFNLYPNPAKDVIVIAIIPELIGQELIMCNIEGKTILKAYLSTASQTIPVQHVPAGIYFIQVNGSTQKIRVE